MAVRKIIQIDQDKCTGCGLCAEACHEGAIGMVNGKAKLMRDDYCDGFGDCLPACPADAITFVEREAADYDEQAVAEAKKQKAQVQAAAGHGGHGCPGSAVHQFQRAEAVTPAVAAEGLTAETVPSEISTWPIQIKLLPVSAPYFDGCDLLIAADCTAFSYGNFHHDFMRGKVCIIGCPKLDAIDYADKLGDILEANDIKSIQVARMIVPCCGGLENAVRRAIGYSGKDIPLEVVTFSLDGQILSVQ